MDDYSFLRDVLETWRSTTDWVKAAVVIVIPGQIAFLVHQVLRYRAECRAMIIEERETMTEARVRQLAEPEFCRIVAEMERARRARHEKNTRPGEGRIAEGSHQWPV